MTNELKHLKLNEEKWDKRAKSFGGKGWRYDYLRQAQNDVISLLEIKENIHFLDVGCGTGRALGEVTKIVNGRGWFFNFV